MQLEWLEVTIRCARCDAETTSKVCSNDKIDKVVCSACAFPHFLSSWGDFNNSIIRIRRIKK